MITLPYIMNNITYLRSRLSNLKLALEKWSLIYDHGDEANGLTSGVAVKKVEFCSTSPRATEEEEYLEEAAEDKVDLTLKKPLHSDEARPLSKNARRKMKMKFDAGVNV